MVVDQVIAETDEQTINAHSDFVKRLIASRMHAMGTSWIDEPVRLASQGPSISPKEHYWLTCLTAYAIGDMPFVGNVNPEQLKIIGMANRNKADALPTSCRKNLLVFAEGEQAVMVAWAEQKCQVELPLGPRAKALRLSGEEYPLTYDRSSGLTIFQITQDPVFVRFADPVLLNMLATLKFEKGEITLGSGRQEDAIVFSLPQQQVLEGRVLIKFPTNWRAALPQQQLSASRLGNGDTRGSTRSEFRIPFSVEPDQTFGWPKVMQGSNSELIRLSACTQIPVNQTQTRSRPRAIHLFANCPILCLADC